MSAISERYGENETIDELAQLRARREVAPAPVAVEARPTREPRIAPDTWAKILTAAEDVLRDPSLFDPRFRDPLVVDVAQRRREVVRVLTEAVREALRQREANPQASGVRIALADLPATDEGTLLRLYDDTIGWGSVQRFLDLPETTEVKFIGNKVQVYTAGEPPSVIDNPLSLEQLERRARLLADDAGEPLNTQECQRSLALAGGTRASITVYPLTKKPLLIFRRGRTEAWTLRTLIEKGTLDEDTADLIRFFLRARICTLIEGSTGSGKTAFLECLLQEIDGHIVTIEDGAQEIRLLDDKLWTPLTVDAVKDSSALANAAVNALRQTPDAIGFGETRSKEAGAILAMATTDHLTLTTIHAPDPRAAVRRFASCASTSGAANYENRFGDALRDTVTTFSLVIRIEYFGQIGRRLVTQVQLACGVNRDETGGLEATMIPLVEVEVDRESHAITWTQFARIAANGYGLEFADGTTRLPEHLETRIKNGLARAWSAGHTGQTAQSRMEETVRRGYAALDADQAPQALAEARAAWAIKREESRVLPLVRDALTHLVRVAGQQQKQATAHHRTMVKAIRGRRWEEARQTFDEVMADPALVAFPPADGWEALKRTIEVGMAQCRTLDRLLERIPARIEFGAARETLSDLLALPTDQLDSERRLRRLRGHVHLMEALLERGQTEAAAVAAVRAQLAAAEQRSTEENPA